MPMGRLSDAYLLLGRPIQPSTILRPTMPIRMRARNASLAREALSPRKMIPVKRHSDCANANPYRIGRSHRQTLECDRQHDDAGDSRDDGNGARPEPGEPFARFKRSGPNDLE